MQKKPHIGENFARPACKSISKRQLGWAFGLLTVLGVLPVLGQTSLSLAGAWGAPVYPNFKPGLKVGATLLSFTSMNGARQPYGVAAADTGLPGVTGPYPETLGYNLVTVEFIDPYKADASHITNMAYRYGLSFGVLNDGSITFLQNGVVHQGYRKMTPVAREKVRCAEFSFGSCSDFSFNGEILYRFSGIDFEDRARFTNTDFFIGSGAALATPYSEGYVQFGVARMPSWRLIRGLVDLRLYSMARFGGLLHQGFFNAYKRPEFPSLAKGYDLEQGGMDFLVAKRVYPIAFHVSVTSHSGIFLDTRGQAMRTLFLTLGIEIDSFHIETFNDLINDTDFGPTFGTRLYADLDPGGPIYTALDRALRWLVDR